MVLYGDTHNWFAAFGLWLFQLFGHEDVRLLDDDATTVYSRIGERSSHSWVVLHHLLGLENAKNYDGSWTEYGNLVGAPIEAGA